MQNSMTKDIKNPTNNLGTSVKNGLDKSSSKSASGAFEGSINTMTDIASDIAHQGYDMVADRAKMASDVAEKTYDTGVDFVKRNPGKALLGAAAVGFLLAGFLRRNP